ncbi:VOC family protein [Sphingobium ummariense]
MTTPIATCLWFDGQAEEAAQFYISALGEGSIDSITPYPQDSPFPSPFPGGYPMLVEFTLMGQRFQGLNGGPMFPFTEAVSISVTCKDQSELDRRYDALTADGGAPGPCGWLKDRFGLSWQLVPEELIALQKSGNAAGITRMSAALMQMQRLDIAALRAAFEGKVE